MNAEKQRLLDDVLGTDRRREATLLAGGHVLRRRRYWRGAARGIPVILGVVLAALGFETVHSRKPNAAPAVLSVVPAQPGPPQSLTDEQLLALFPNTPVGLITLANGQKRLIFPRPGDEAKCVTRL